MVLTVMRPLWFLALLVLAAPAAAREALPPGFVYLRDVDASIAQDMRYATADNFTGRPLPGYDAAECVLRRPVAEALARAQASLRRENLGLKVYDCYRPQRAVTAMARWAQARADETATRRFYPALEKRRLFALGYIAAQSRHSTGTAVDLTLIALPRTPPTRFDPRAAYGPCTAAAAQRAPDDSLDMGTGYDCFDARSHTASRAVTAEQQRRRAQLVAALRPHGLHNYAREWWHFSFYGVKGAPAYDVPIAPR